MSYALSDFTESVARASFHREDIKRVVSACGFSPEGYASWEGSFVLELNDGRWCILSGWCDTTGWGCRDGIDEDFFPSEETIVEATEHLSKNEKYKDIDWDKDPVDLNRWVQGEINDGWYGD